MRKLSTESSLASNTPDDRCPLHLDTIQDAYNLPCGHAACHECLYAIATASRKFRRPHITCPVCQKTSPFEPEQKELEEAQFKAESRCELSRSPSISDDPRSRSSSLSSHGGSTAALSPIRRRESMKINKELDVNASKLTISNDPMVNKRVTITLRLCDQDGKIIIPKSNTYVRGTILFPDGELKEIELLPYRPQSLGINDLTHSFEKVFVPQSVGKYEVDIPVSDNSKEHIIAYILVKPSGGKVFDLRGMSKFKNPHDIFLTGGQYVITDKGNHRIIVTDREGVVQMEFGSTPPKGLKRIGPFAIAGDPGAYYVTDDANKCVLQFVRTTAKLRLWAKVGPSPTGIALDIEHVYVADAKESNVRVFNRHAQQLFTIAYPGNLDGAVSYPWFIKINSKGNLVVADRNNCRIQIFDPHSKKSLLLISPDLCGKRWHCRGLALDRLDNIYVTCRRTDSWCMYNKETVMVFSASGDYLGNFGELCEFNYIRGIAIDDDQATALVVDGANHRIKGYRL
ncbi:uncharacterized protein LOC129273388 [Lytechinus pictus]|uniref:uncharacterized protein LOC129273388 n=1 Tax=Lytechinus pictus TaxID=7653 RepID=UPI0030B9EFFD